MCAANDFSRGEDSIKRVSVGYDVNSINFAAAPCLPSSVMLRGNISLAVYRGDIAWSRIGSGVGEEVRNYFPYNANILRY